MRATSEARTRARAGPGARWVSRYDVTKMLGGLPRRGRLRGMALGCS